MNRYSFLIITLLATTFTTLAQDKYHRVMQVYVNGYVTYQKAVTEFDSVAFNLVPVDPIATPDIETPQGTLTVSQANALCATLEDGSKVGKDSYVKGWVKEIKQESDSTLRTFYIAENLYHDGTWGDATFLAYQVHYLNNQSFRHETQVAVGDYVVICGNLMNDNGTYRTVGDGQAYVYSTSNTRTIPGFIDVTDRSVSDWDALPAEHVYSCVGDPAAAHTALTSLKVYCDAYYINLLVEFEEEQILDRDWTPLHIVFDIDNNDATGGFADWFADANTDIMLETGIFLYSEPYNYDPSVFKWWGEVGGSGWQWTDPSEAHTDDDCWGAVVCEGQGVGKSQIIGNKIEIQLLRTKIPFTFADTFGIGVDIEQAWAPVGILPNAAADAKTGKQVLAPKLKVTTHK